MLIFRMIKEGNKLGTNCDTFKSKTKNGKTYNIDTLNTKVIIRLILASVLQYKNKEDINKC